MPHRPLTTTTDIGTQANGVAPPEDPFLALSRTHWNLAEDVYSDPVALSNPTYVHTVAAWPAYHLMRGTLIEQIWDLSNDIEGPLLTRFRKALEKLFAAAVERAKPLIETIVDHYRCIAETCIYFNKTRGAQALIDRLSGEVERADKSMTSLLALRTEQELGAAAGAAIRSNHLFDTKRYPANYASLFTKLQKSHLSPSLHKRNRQNAPPGICEYCLEPITGGFAQHNKVCTAREAVKGKHVDSTSATLSAPLSTKKSSKKKRL